MTATPGQTAPPARRPRDRWLDHLHGVVVLLVVVNAMAIGAGLLLTVLSGWPNKGIVDYGFPYLTVPEAEVALDSGLTSGTQAIDVVVQVKAYHGRLAPLMAALSLFTWLPGALTGLLALWWLRRITEHHHDDRRLFSMASVGYLRRIGATLLIGSVAAAVLGWAAKTVAGHLLLTNSYPVQPVVPTDSGSGFWILVIMGIAALAIAEVIRRGLMMREDLEGTV